MNRSDILTPSGINRDKLAREIEIAAKKLEDRETDGILILLDSDEQDPLEWEPKLRTCAHEIRSDIAIGVGMACRQYENWFLGALSSLRPGAAVPEEPEAVQNAKAFLREHVLEGRKYVQRLHQALYTKQMDLELARRNCPSLERLWQEVRGLVEQARK